MKKSNIIVFGGTDQTEIAGFEVVKEIKYLGVKIQDKKDIFKKFIDDKVSIAKKYRFWMPFILQGKILKASIGKTFWKGAILPTVLHGYEACAWSKNQINQLDKIQNVIFKNLLNLPTRAANAYAQAEIGASTQKFRDMKAKVLFLMHIVQNTNKLKNKVFKWWNTKQKWINICKNYLTELNIDLMQLEDLDKSTIKKMINDVQFKQWKLDANKISSIEAYVKSKKTFTPYKEWENTYQQTILRKFQCGSILVNSKPVRMLMIKDALFVTILRP